MKGYTKNTREMICTCGGLDSSKRKPHGEFEHQVLVSKMEGMHEGQCEWL